MNDYRKFLLKKNNRHIDEPLTPREAYEEGFTRYTPNTQRKARCTGVLAGRTPPRYTKRGNKTMTTPRDWWDWEDEATTFHGDAA